MIVSSRPTARLIWLTLALSGVACDWTQPSAEVVTLQAHKPLPAEGAVVEHPAVARSGVSAGVNAGWSDLATVFAPFSPLRRWLNPSDAAPRDREEGSGQVADLLRERSLSSMAYVGYVASAGQRVAMLRIDGQVLVARVGERLGSEGAELKRVGERALDLVIQVNGTEGGAMVVLPRLMLQGQDHGQ